MTQELDFYDATIFDPFMRPPEDDLLSGEETSKAAEDDTENNLSSDCDNKNEGSGDEEEKSSNSSEITVTYKEKTVEDELIEKVGSQDDFTLGLWSSETSSHVKSVDVWDVPSGSVPWDDNDKPFEKLLQYAELELTEEEEEGILTDRIIAACSSYLALSPGTNNYVVAKVCLNNKNLNNIEILAYHRHLQYVDLSWNNLTDLTPLGCIPYLMYLDVSHNLIKEVLRFTPPFNLTYVNYSYNEVWQIDDLKDFWALSYLDLSHNRISKIQGLENLRYLRHLDLSYNKIAKFENLNNLRITDINLEFNLISKFETGEKTGIVTMPFLVNLYLSNNLIENLKCFQGVYRLKKLELQSNDISDVTELLHLKSLKNLRVLDISENPVTEVEHYRSVLLSMLPVLQYLDECEVDAAEKVAACKLKSYDVKLEAAKNNARLMLLDQFNDPSVDLDIIPVDQGPYPLVVLVGPAGSSKKSIITKLAEKYKDKVYIGRLHTTRDLVQKENSVLISVSREEFSEKVKNGEFLCVMELLGHLYGFSRKTLAEAVKEHKLCITSMDMEGALTIHSYGMQPFLILSMPKSEEHLSRLRSLFTAVAFSPGAARINVKGFLELKTENEKFVMTILDDLLEEVIQLVQDRKISSSRSVFKSKYDYLSETSSNELSPDSLEIVIQKKHDVTSVTENCSSNRGTDDDAFPQYQTNKSSTNVSCKSEFKENPTDSNDTSYSAYSPGPFKMHYPSYNGSMFGEYERFNGWSLPFTDWDEFNVQGFDWTETAEKFRDLFIEKVISSRDVYESINRDNPGLFSFYVNTDDVDKAAKKSSKHLIEIWHSTPLRKPIFDMKNDSVYQALIPKKIEKHKEMINDRFSATGGNFGRKITSDSSLSSRPSIISQMQQIGCKDVIDKL